MGTESELLSLEGMWREYLERPLFGLKSPIREFHASDCFNSAGEFEGWKRHETDYYRHELREVIIRSHVGGYGIAYFRQDWDDIVKGDLRNLFGSAEGNAVRNCFVRALRWANINCFDPDITFAFDGGDDPDRKRDIHAVYDAFRRHGNERNLCGVSFLDSKKFAALQVADLFAWELNRNAHKILERGMSTPSTQEYIHLGKGMHWMDAQIARKESIAKMMDFARGQHAPEDLSQMGDYFRDFGPVIGARKKRLRQRLSQKPLRKP